MLSRGSTRFVLLALTAGVLASCETATEPGADDPEEPAVTTGQVAFYTDVAGLAPITVQVGGSNVRITSAFSSAPSCGQSGAGTMTLGAGAHGFTAAGAGGITWDGTVNITAGGCLRFRLTGTVPVTPPGTGGSFTVPSTYFMDPSGTLGANNGFATQAFTLTTSRTLVLRFVAEYQAQAAIIPASQLNAFTSGQSFTGYANFNRTIGTETVTIPAGQYYLAVRNSTASSNRYRAELDYDIQLAPQNGRTFSYVDSPLTGARTVAANGGKVWHGFSVQAGFRYLLDGANVGVDSYIIPASELSNFQAGRQFQFYSDYKGEGGAFPGLWEINLPAGSYYLVMQNDESRAMPITYTMERWRVN